MNNATEYEVVNFRVKTSRMIGILDLIFFNDSRLLVNYYVWIFEGKDDKMIKYLERLKHENS